MFTKRIATGKLYMGVDEHQPFLPSDGDSGTNRKGIKTMTETEKKFVEALNLLAHVAHVETGKWNEFRRLETVLASLDEAKEEPAPPSDDEAEAIVENLKPTKDFAAAPWVKNSVKQALSRGRELGRAEVFKSEHVERAKSSAITKYRERQTASLDSMIYDFVSLLKESTDA